MTAANRVLGCCCKRRSVTVSTCRRVSWWATAGAILTPAMRRAAKPFTWIAATANVVLRKQRPCEFPLSKKL